MNKIPIWIKDFDNFLRGLKIDGDKRLKIINTMIKVFKEKKKQWEKRQTNQGKLL